MQIPLIIEHLFCENFVRRSVGQTTKSRNVKKNLMKGCVIFFLQISLINEHLFCKCFVRLSVGNATKGFATYGCFHPCSIYISIYLFYIFSSHPLFLLFVNALIKPCNRNSSHLESWRSWPWGRENWRRKVYWTGKLYWNRWVPSNLDTCHPQAIFRQYRARFGMNWNCFGP